LFHPKLFSMGLDSQPRCRDCSIGRRSRPPPDDRSIFKSGEYLKMKFKLSIAGY